jgi:hypothetical protein
MQEDLSNNVKDQATMKKEPINNTRCKKTEVATQKK